MSTAFEDPCTLHFYFLCIFWGLLLKKHLPLGLILTFFQEEINFLLLLLVFYLDLQIQGEPGRPGIGGYGGRGKPVSSSKFKIQ